MCISSKAKFCDLQLVPMTEPGAGEGLVIISRGKLQLVAHLNVFFNAIGSPAQELNSSGRARVVWASLLEAGGKLRFSSFIPQGSNMPLTTFQDFR